MNVPESLRNADRHGAIVRTVEYDDTSVIAVDFGSDAGDVSIDIVGDTALIVTDGEQFEFELPPEASDVSAKNGVLTITE
ncbi:DUF7127 family protein [Halopiger aswanensis]|uniref:Hsp20/alpha crystallin family protein n=1 Tax=Halopiger aswanensis TaxID=148449 RepID=A0A3R7KJZ1_9EURY|nr:hypothetical protein [Halopiger aswanensis]RKD93744.1 hypothetical protein ATJ93_3376 [Halopiger aswanensis]